MRRLDPARLLAAAQLTDAVGLGGYLVCSGLYFTRIVGLTPTEVGLGLTVGWAVGLLAGVPLGHLADRYGARGITSGLALAAGATLGLFLLVDGLLAFVVVASLYGAAQCGLAAARQGLLAALVAPGERTRVRAMAQAAINGGIAVGAGLGGLALHLDTPAAYRAVFVLDAVSLVVSALVTVRLPAAAGGPPADGAVLAVLRDRPYAVLAALNMVLQLHIPLITLAIPLWIVQRTEAPGWTVSALLVLNTLSVVVFQVRVARRVTGLVSAARQVRAAGVVLLAACAVFALSAAGSSGWVAVVILLAAGSLQALAEMMQASGSWELGFGLAPAGRHGQYQGFYGSGFAVARMVGPLLVTTVVLGWGAWGWLALGALFLLAGLATVPAVHMARERILQNSFA